MKKIGKITDKKCNYCDKKITNKNGKNTIPQDAFESKLINDINREI